MARTVFLFPFVAFFLLAFCCLGPTFKREKGGCVCLFSARACGSDSSTANGQCIDPTEMIKSMTCGSHPSEVNGQTEWISDLPFGSSCDRTKGKTEHDSELGAKMSSARLLRAIH